MEIAILTFMFMEWLILFGVIQLGKRGLHRGRSPGRPLHREVLWPSVALIVPVTGSDRNPAPSAASFLSQDYPAYQVLFVLRSKEDEAFPIIQGVLQAHRHGACVFSGSSRHCGRKNQSLLAGVRRAGENCHILAFGDSGHMASSNWLRSLVDPIARGHAAVTTGFHRMVPKNSGIASLGWVITVLALHLLQAIEPFTQPWGGATAIRRKIFEDLGIARLWAESLVDDVSLAARLRKAGIRVVPVPEATLSTPMDKETFRSWATWLTRQLFYLKLHFPVAWAAAGSVQYILMGLVLLSAIRCILASLGMVSFPHSASAIFFLLSLTVPAEMVRRMHSRPVPFVPWLLGGYAFIFVTCWSHFQSWLTQTIHWRGVSYRVDRDGKVIEFRQL